MQSKNGLQICEGISYSSFSVNELDVIVHKIISLYNPIEFLAILCPTSLASVAVEVALGIVTRYYCKHATIEDRQQDPDDALYWCIHQASI